MKTRTLAKSPTKALVLCALLAAATAVLSQISVPLPFTPVPINLATLAVFVAGGLLGPVYGAVSLTVYVMLGAVGLPVFAQFSGGVGIILGPTGGYILGYIGAAWLTGLIINRLPKNFLSAVVAMIAGLLVCYALGTAWFMVETGTSFIAALGMCVMPFLIGDALKIACASFLVNRLARVI
ncbi:MAG: biotin transporter BioY [Acetanaerobacterium sp.]